MPASNVVGIENPRYACNISVGGVEVNKAGLVISALLATTILANAADLPGQTYAKASPYIAPITNWQGFYIGGHGGYAWSNDISFGSEGTVQGTASKPSGGFAGGQIGYNWQLSRNWVFGLEADASFGDNKYTFTTPFGGVGSKFQSFGSTTARFGFAADNWLLYAKGGWGWGDNKVSTSQFFSTASNTSESQLHSAWTAGAGVEWMFMPQWSIKAEYQYYDFGTQTYFNTLGLDEKIHTFKGGVNYHFGSDVASLSYVPAFASNQTVTNWTGFYVGAEGGYVWSSNIWTTPVDGGGTATVARHDSGGDIAGGVVGVNYQFAQNWVVGVEGNFDWANIRSSKVCFTNTDDFCRNQINSIYSATPRIGYALGSLMVYGKAGATWTSVRNSAGQLNTGVATEYGWNDRSGWTVGAGLEWMFASRWSAKIEYDYYDFGGQVEPIRTSDGFSDEGVFSKLTVSSIKAGINYHL